MDKPARPLDKPARPLDKPARPLDKPWICFTLEYPGVPCKKNRESQTPLEEQLRRSYGPKGPEQIREHLPCFTWSTPGVPLECPWSTLEYPGVPWSTLEYPGVPLEYPWSTLEYPAKKPVRVQPLWRSNFGRKLGESCRRQQPLPTCELKNSFPPPGGGK